MLTNGVLVRLTHRRQERFNSNRRIEVMKKTKSLIAFVICMWAVVVATYAAQVRNEGEKGLQSHLIKFDLGASCSTTTTSSSE